MESRGPLASLVLKNSEDRFLVREQEITDKGGSTGSFAIKTGRLRAAVG
ncbi:hypothetical protein DFAR_2040005 [Desulfarculales bacterium]